MSEESAFDDIPGTIFVSGGAWSRIHPTLSAMLSSRETAPVTASTAWSTTRAFWIAQSTSVWGKRER